MPSSSSPPPHTAPVTTLPSIAPRPPPPPGPPQGFMAKILKDVLGDKLFVPSEGQPGAEWLSPEALKGKVLIRANAGKLTNASMKVR
eukprot:363609-Chlamydomonas_euryale.AAC.3